MNIEWNFVPAPDELLKQFGPTVACVYGRMWRYMQMSDRVCKASIQTIADDIGVGYNTVLRAIQKLVESGFLIDITPDLRNRPHIYRVNGKRALAKMEEHAMPNWESHSPKMEEHSSKMEEHAMPNWEMSQSLLREELIETIREGDGGLSELSRCYETNIGIITPMTREMLVDDLEEYGYQLCVDAIEEAVKNNIRKWSYVRGILKNWKANGRRVKPQAGVTPAEGMSIYV